MQLVGLELTQVKDYTKTIEPGFNVSTHVCMHTVRLLKLLSFTFFSERQDIPGAKGNTG